MTDQRICSECGRPIPIGETDCPACNADLRASTYRPETVFALSLVILVLLFVVTGFAVRTYHAKEQALGREWFEQGASQMKDGRPEDAIVDFRTALIYERNNDDYELNLAKALLAAHHVQEASAHLTILWDRQPVSGEVNLELGRLAAQSGDVTQALQYFHNAIYGNWQEEDAAEQRRNARLELYQFLMRHGADRQAQAELLAMAAELPPDPLLHVQVGRMFLDANQISEAERQFREALRFDRNNADALAGAGQAEFRMGDFRNSANHLERALRQEPDNKPMAKMLETARLVLSIDPFEPSLSATERTARIARAFDQAESRLQDCAEEKGETLETSAPQTPLQNLYAEAMKITPRVKARILSRDPDAASAALAWIERAEETAATLCGPPSGLDEAIVLAWRSHGGLQK